MICSKDYMAMQLNWTIVPRMVATIILINTEIMIEAVAQEEEQVIRLRKVSGSVFLLTVVTPLL